MIPLTLLSPELLEFARWLNAVLATADLILVIAGMVTTWDRGAADYRLRHMAMGLILVSIAYGSVEAAVLNVPTGPRTLLVTLALLWLLVAYLLPDRLRQYPRKPTPPERSRHGLE